jgi:hypothetical protein
MLFLPQPTGLMAAMPGIPIATMRPLRLASSVQADAILQSATAPNTAALITVLRIIDPSIHWDIRNIAAKPDMELWR